MKLGVFMVLFSRRPFEEALDYVASLGVQSVEIGVGGYVGNAHCHSHELLQDDAKLKAFARAVESRGLQISALSCHGNALHPNGKLAQQFHEDFQNAVLLAEKLDVPSVVTFSGCPGESERSENPVWITCPWPDDFSRVVEWQWSEKVLPYWQSQSGFLKDHHVKVAIEPHPGFNVYSSETFLRLREACGEQIGVNFDPSHLFWQGMNPVDCIREMAEAGALLHFHAKDTAIASHNTAKNGVLDTKSYRDTRRRSWIFRTVGYGHDETVWRDMISMLQQYGYDGTLSIEHEDALMSPEEGFEKAVSFLKALLIKERTEQIWWA